jgi:hypothetical protein
MSYLKEDNGKNSSGRLIFFVGSFWNMAMTTYLLLSGVDPAVSLAFFSGVEAVLIGLKIGGKQQETGKKTE